MRKYCLNCRWSHARDDADLEFCVHPKSPNYGEFIYDIKENNPCEYWGHILSGFNWPQKHKIKDGQVREDLHNMDLFDEGIPAESPREYCEYCGQELKTLKQKAEGLCNDCLKATGGITGGKR